METFTALIRSIDPNTSAIELHVPGLNLSLEDIPEPDQTTIYMLCEFKGSLCPARLMLEWIGEGLMGEYKRGDEITLKTVVLKVCKHDVMLDLSAEHDEQIVQALYQWEESA